MMHTTSSPAAKATLVTPLTQANRDAVVQEEHVIDHCLVCYSSLADYHVITPCGHAEICGVCHLRLRYLHADRKCPICKAESEQVIVDLTTSDKLEFSEYNIWGNDLGADFIYNEESQMFVRTDYYERELKPLFGYRCNCKNCSFDATAQVNKSENKNNGESNHKSKKPIRVLQDHLRIQHKLALCQLCVDHQRDFVSQLPRFTPSQLQTHLSRGDPAAGFHGHPLCEFCRPTRFYDITALHHHLALEHFKCHVCEKQGLSDQYFKNYSQLEKHFDRQHFLCRDVQCLMARFVVFGNELDLKHHQRTVHGATLGDTKIQLEFRVARSSNAPPNQSVPNDEEFNYGVDGQAFVPAALPGNNEGGSNTVALHPLHVQRTAQLREQAASLRISNIQASQAEEFPTLQPNTAGANAALRTGWTSAAQRTRTRGPAGAVTQEDFPSLPAAAPALRGKVNKLQALRPQPKPASAPIASWGTAARPLPSSSGVNHFPSLSSTAAAPSMAASRKKPPPMNSLSDFPAPPMSSSPYIGLPTASVAAANVTIEDMKATMGSLGYKQLKQLTQNLVVHKTINPVDYVQSTAALFDHTNTHQKFVTALLQSCPPHPAAQEALQRLLQSQVRGLAVNNKLNSNGSSQNSSNNAWTKKSKQNKELRQLAFGR
ncbi:hypothetical protein FisN_30Lu134 [Fistulifera solaris]|uniref:RING-type domain-containing protein n=1 Tax=Fistulifera solaris TaxID=1519565 RepID=A0A1Z5JIK2_FISSO|nr:hypothetical protein FisN_30Lu134 [Fistulifera solaris]|eukprot:GAX13834.1 hypothetical protein FisN_30Lu134 [Fistulifera solaris]